MLFRSFLLGMSVMTSGLKALAGSRLRTTLSNVAATPLSGAFWGAFVTLIAQSSSATTMTTIGLVSAGLLTFAQGLALVFGANVGTTGTGWLIALIGVRVSLTAAALPRHSIVQPGIGALACHDVRSNTSQPQTCRRAAYQRRPPMMNACLIYLP